MSGGLDELTTAGFGWSNMFVSPEDDPRAGGGLHGERETLVGFLRDQRLTFELKCSGLDAKQLARRSVPPSRMSLLGLVRHLAGVEQSWFRLGMAGEDHPRHFRSGSDRDEDFNGAVADDEVVRSAWELWRSSGTLLPEGCRKTSNCCDSRTRESGRDQRGGPETFQRRRASNG